MRKQIIRIIIIALIYVISMQNIICARNYNVNGANVEYVDDISPKVACWTGWKEWHFGATTPISKKGDKVTFRRPMIADGKTMYFVSDATTNGYGYFGLDFGKHVLGLLSYIKDKITNYMTDYIPAYDQPEFNEFGEIVEPETVMMKDAINITIDKLIRTWYSREYEKNEFTEFWDKGLKKGDVVELRKLQNKFYWQAYGARGI